jgi:penicillin-insensitive murein endopeptidase
MLTRVTTFLALSLVFMAGTLALAQRITLAQAPTTDTPPAQTTAEPAEATAPIEPAAPSAATAPTDPSPTPAVPTPGTAPAASTPPVETSAPVAATPPAQPSTPEIVTTTPLPREKPPLEGSHAVAKLLFSHMQLPSLGKALAIGYYPRGCLAGGVELPINGPTWQVMRVSRNRNWGHPSLVRFLERFAPLAAKATGWKGILVGDMAQPRGGPLPYGHASHQIGLDVDIWFMPMPDHTLTSDEREKTSAINLVSDDWKHINPKTWTPQHIAFIRTAAEQPEVERVLVNAAIKKEICRVDGKNGGTWLRKIRPWYGHHDHIHVRIKCPADSPNCRKQPPVPDDNGCADKDFAYWFSDKVLKPQRDPNAKPPRPLTMADLPPACQTVINAPARTPKN